mmetsp:Transcript_57145/g.133222  ORF Transcript_57145/g.133222 Transcript_57145/m.133222 type:complete len:274 (-) Transcript_57145:91-912(-)
MLAKPLARTAVHTEHGCSPPEDSTGLLIDPAIIGICPPPQIGSDIIASAAIPQSPWAYVHEVHIRTVAPVGRMKQADRQVPLFCEAHKAQLLYSCNGHFQLLRTGVAKGLAARHAAPREHPRGAPAHVHGIFPDVVGLEVDGPVVLVVQPSRDEALLRLPEESEDVVPANPKPVSAKTVVITREAPIKATRAIAFHRVLLHEVRPLVSRPKHSVLRHLRADAMVPIEEVCEGCATLGRVQPCYRQGQLLGNREAGSGPVAFGSLHEESSSANR